MAFNGYLLKIGTSIFPSSFIQLDTYKSTPNQILDLDSYTDSNGILHRNILPARATKIEFNTPILTLDRKMALQALLPSSRVKFTLQYWNDDTNSYKTGDFYIPDITYEIKRHTSNNIWYNPVRIAMIDYGTLT